MKVQFTGKAYCSYRVFIQSPGIYDIPDDVAVLLLERRPDLFKPVEEPEEPKEESSAVTDSQVPRRRKRGRPSTEELLRKFKALD